VGSPPSPLARMAQGPHAGQARDRHQLAPKKIPALLEMEEPPETDRSTRSIKRNPRPDPTHEFRKRALGSTPASFTGRAEVWRWSPGMSENRPPSAPARSRNLESGPSVRFRADLHPATAFAAPGTLQVNQARRRTWNVRGARFHILPGRGPPETTDTYSSATAISAGVRL
jgi:hypothetical protein